MKICQLFRKAGKMNWKNQPRKLLSLGFSSYSLPEKKWLLKALFQLKDTNDILKKYLDSDFVVRLKNDLKFPNY
ncbi:unnamed protein product [Paramecium primaurelia]|uniref:Uncharacterized protein n=1 Tax=Paramecium primaurelia TaxID=5886 RepID=A0A8S1PV95_PARPR|nr:unnamed protein product [Paramecium primaurelia]